MSASDGGDAPYSLEAFLQTSADCFEAALISMQGARPIPNPNPNPHTIPNPNHNPSPNPCSPYP
jgi:hypothetical protein